MNRPRLPLGLESSRATLNPDVCVQLGRKLAAAREARALGVRDVAASLLLSPCQVKGLEAADPEAFYSAELFLVAARKYDALVELNSSLLADVLAAPLANTDVTPARRPIGSASQLRVVRLVLAAAAVVAVSGMVVWSVVSGQTADPAGAAAPAAFEPPTLNHLVSSSLLVGPVEVQLAEPPAPPARIAKVSQPAAPSTVARGDHGYVRVNNATWVFVRYRDNTTVERVLEPGQRLVLQDRPIYLAAGAASGAEVVVDGERIDVTRFDVNGQLRIGAAFLSAAVR